MIRSYKPFFQNLLMHPEPQHQSAAGFNLQKETVFKQRKSDWEIGPLCDFESFTSSLANADNPNQAAVL